MTASFRKGRIPLPAKAAVLALLALLPRTAAAQQSERTFSAPLDVVIVNVDVVALDGDGRTVTDLSREELRVWEDGTEVEISHFAAPDPAGRAPRDPVNLVLLLDDARLEPASRRDAIDHLRRLLAAARAGEPEHPDGSPSPTPTPALDGSGDPPAPAGVLRTMVLTMDPGLEIACPLTDDLAAAERALAELARRRVGSLIAQERSRLLREMQVAAGEVASEGQSSQYGRPAPRSARPLEATDYASSVALGFLHQIQDHARTVGEAQRIAFEVLGRLLRSLSGLEGRTALLVVSDGLATNPGEPLIRAWEQLFHNIVQSIAVQPRAILLGVDTTEATLELVRLATAHRVTVVELRGGSGRQLDSLQAEVKGLAFGSGFGAAGSFGETPALALLAAATGGRSVAVGAKTLERDLAAALREVMTSYSLGYRPPSPRDGAFHELRVEVERPGVTLRHREGYMAAEDADTLIDRTLAAAVLGVTDDPIGLELVARPPTRREDGKLVLPLAVGIPLRRLGLKAHGAAHEGRIAVALAVRGENGRIRGLERREFPVAVANDDFPAALGETVEVLFNLVVDPGALCIGVGVHDAYGDLAATSAVEIGVGTPSG